MNTNPVHFLVGLAAIIWAVYSVVQIQDGRIGTGEATDKTGRAVQAHIEKHQAVIDRHNEAMKKKLNIK